jgi:putative membrane protein insertion efficiency factor
MRWLIRAYRRFISPFTLPRCRFQPTCSAYAEEAVERYGSWRGSWLALKRILRCQPLARPGYDPVPESFSWWGRETAGREAAAGAKPPDAAD